ANSRLELLRLRQVFGLTTLSWQQAPRRELDFLFSAAETAHRPSRKSHRGQEPGLLGRFENASCLTVGEPRGPFHGMGEENLRRQFRVPLNSSFKGAASGETFNSQERPTFSSKTCPCRKFNRAG